MTEFRYVACPECPTISRLSPDEKTCLYCGHDLQAGKEVTEREWRQYWIGVRGQYPQNSYYAKKSKQLFLNCF